MIRTVSLWIRVRGKFSQPRYQDNKQTRLKPQDGEYYLRCAGKWYPVGNDPLLALDAKAAKEKLLRAVERGAVPESEALPHLNPPAQTRLSVRAAIFTYLTTGKAAQKDWRKHTRQCSIPCFLATGVTTNKTTKHCSARSIFSVRLSQASAFHWPATSPGMALWRERAILHIDAESWLVGLSRVLGQAFFSNRVIQTKITAPTNATMIEPIMLPPGQIPKSPKTQPPTTPPRMPRMMSTIVP
jgi:hypothetical protein